MASKQPCAKYQYVVTPAGPKILPVDEPSCKDEESPADYNSGGYLPVKVNDTFSNGRYRVVRKLGWGHFSTVWLVKDTQTLRHSALKVVKSAGRYADTARDEIKLLSRVSSISPLHPGREHIVSFLDSFSHQGPEALHVCIVFEPLGENLLALIERHKKKGVPRPLVRMIAKQLLLGLDYLHDECDLVHTDIKPENILISIPDIETHIHNELSLSPSPTSRRVGVPLPTKTRSGVSIPYNQQRSRRQVQIFDSQPLASPGRSAGRSANGNSSLSMNTRLDNGGSGNVSRNGSYKAQTHLSRAGFTFATGTTGSLGSSAPKIPSGLSASAPRHELPFHAKTAQMFAAKGITAVPPRIINSPSTSSSSSSISSALVTARTSSIVSTPPTSLSHSFGNAAMEFVGTGKFENELRTWPRISPKRLEVGKETLVVGPIRVKPKPDLEQEISAAISMSWKNSEIASGAWKNKVSASVPSGKSQPSPHNARLGPPSGVPPMRSRSGLFNPQFWKDPGASAPAPAVLVSAVVGAGGLEGPFSTVPTIVPHSGVTSNSTSQSSSATATIVMPSPTGTPLPITKQAPSHRENNATHDISSHPGGVHSSSSSTNHLSLLTRTAPARPPFATSPAQRPTARASPPQQVSQLSAHMHLHRPPQTHSTNTRSKTSSRSSRLVGKQPVTFTKFSPTSVTPTPASPPPPPPTPNDSPSISALTPHSIPPSLADVSPSTLHDLHFPHLQTVDDDEPCPPPISIKIADLGNATPSSKHFTEDIQTRQYRAPEAILGRRDWDARADIWSVACVIFELLTAEYLFDPQGQGELFTKDDDHMAQIIELLGDFPLEIKMGGKYSRELFDHTGSLRYIRALKPWPLKRVMTEKYLFSDSDAAALCDFLEPMLVVDMRHRAQARDQKDHVWLQPTEEDGVVMEW